MKNMKEELIKEYMMNGGQSWSIIAYIMYRIDKYKEDIEYKMKEVLSIQENLSVEGIRDRKINKILDK